MVEELQLGISIPNGERPTGNSELPEQHPALHPASVADFDVLLPDHQEKLYSELN